MMWNSARFLVKDIGVAAVPGSSFFRNPAAGKDLIRFTFCKKDDHAGSCGRAAHPSSSCNLLARNKILG